MNKRSKNQIYLFRFYDTETDGYWEMYDFNPKRKYPNILRKDSVKYKLKKSLENKLGYGGVEVRYISVKPVYGSVYHVIVDVRKDSDLCKAYKALGFIEF